LFAVGGGRLARFTLRTRLSLRRGYYLLVVRVPGAAVDYQVIYV
jgi:hypothetical protein